MRYQVTEQYERGEERFIAEFSRIENWVSFKSIKTNEAQSQHQLIIYRLYDDTDLIEVVNPFEVSTSRAQYADSGRLIGMSAPLVYDLILRSQERDHCLACFDEYADVKLFLEQRCEDDRTLMPQDVFCIFKHRVLIETYSVHSVRAWTKTEAHPLTAHFNPTPTPTTFKPPGFPEDHWCDDEESDEKRN
jgi:hypothetical protein